MPITTATFYEVEPSAWAALGAALLERERLSRWLRRLGRALLWGAL